MSLNYWIQLRRERNPVLLKLLISIHKFMVHWPVLKSLIPRSRWYNTTGSAPYRNRDANIHIVNVVKLNQNLVADAHIRQTIATTIQFARVSLAFD